MTPSAGAPRRFTWRMTASSVRRRQSRVDASPQELLAAVSEAAQFPRPVAPPDAGVGSVLPNLFGGRVINDGTGMIKIETERIVEPGGRLSVAVEVNWPMILANAVARLYVVADANRQPLLARVLLIPDIVPPHVCMAGQAEESGYVRAVVECGDGALLQVKRWVWVMRRAHEPPSRASRGSNDD